MGDIGLQTACEPLGDARYRAVVSDDWEIWGPGGGYVAAIALRAAGAESPFGRPGSSPRVGPGPCARRATA